MTESEKDFWQGLRDRIAATVEGLNNLEKERPLTDREKDVRSRLTVSVKTYDLMRELEEDAE